MHSSQQPTTIRPATRLKWGLFRLLERLSDLRGNSAAGHLELSLPASAFPSLWVFVSTIGELNAIDPLLRDLEGLRQELAEFPQYALKRSLKTRADKAAKEVTKVKKAKEKAALAPALPRQPKRRKAVEERPAPKTGRRGSRQ